MNIDNEPWRLGFWRNLKKRLAPFFDLTSWVLFAITLVPLYLVAPAMVTTLVQWVAFGVALAGVTVVLSRIMAPMINLAELYHLVMHDEDDYPRSRRYCAAALIVAVLLFMGMLFIGLVLWASK